MSADTEALLEDLIKRAEHEIVRNAYVLNAVSGSPFGTASEHTAKALMAKRRGEA